MTDKQIIIDGKECRYWFRLNPDDYRKCSLRGKDDNCDEIKDCFIKELLGKLALKEQEFEELKTKKEIIDKLRAKEQECNNLKEELRCNRRSIKDLSIESSEICKILEKYKQALDEIEEYLDAQQRYFDGEDYHNLLDIINKTKGETDEES